jgi:hypothetical protein
MLLVQEFLQNHSFKELQEQHGVYASFSKSGHKWSLNYDQIEAKEADPLAQECRGLVLACEDGHVAPFIEKEGRANRDHIIPGKTKILAFPMKRFFNHGQGSAATINWGDPKLAVLEKLDGTLCILYHDPFTNQWCVATRSVPEADLLMDNGIFTFRTLFEKALLETCGKNFNQFTSDLNSRITYCFELTTPYNRIVVYYPESRITLLAARRLYGDLEEFDFSNLGGMGWVEYDELDDNIKEHLTSLGHDAKDTPEAFVAKPYDLAGVPVVKAYTYTTIDQLLTWVSSLNPMEHEGVVVRDANFNRIKVKNAAYVAYNKVRDTLATSARNCVELILAEKDDDVISFLPEDIVNNLLKIKAGIQQGIKQYDETYQQAYQQANAVKSDDKKTFAILITQDKKLWTAPFFQMYDGKAANMKDFIMKNRKDGTWADSFLDKILEISNANQSIIS